MQRHINTEFHDNDSSHYAQLYLYDPKFAIKQYITKKSQLNPDLFCQLTEVLYGCNPFININKTVVMQIHSFNINAIKKIRKILYRVNKLVIDQILPHECFKLKKKEMLCLIKSENIFGRFYVNIYTIEHQKRGLSHMHFLIFLHSTNQFLQASLIDQVIHTKHSIVKSDSIGELIRIVTLVIFYTLYGDV